MLVQPHQTSAASSLGLPHVHPVTVTVVTLTLLYFLEKRTPVGSESRISLGTAVRGSQLHIKKGWMYFKTPPGQKDPPPHCLLCSAKSRIQSQSKGNKSHLKPQQQQHSHLRFSPRAILQMERTTADRNENALGRRRKILIYSQSFLSTLSMS